MEPTFKQKILMKEKWLKAFFVVLFGIFSYIVQMIVWLVAAIQFLFLLFTGTPHRRLTELGESLSTYLYQVTRYLTFCADDKPFPFGDWPKTKEELLPKE